MNNADELGLSEKMQVHLKKSLSTIKADIEQMLATIDQKECCILNEFEQIHSVFTDMQMTAASYYLNAYLSPYTDRYMALSTALQHLSERNHGALIVVKRNDAFPTLVHSGIPVGADVSYTLLESIFYPGGPLHDGAVLVDKNQIVSAGNVLPVSKALREGKLGTRHRAALGLSEISDALILVVSEETGRVSFALNGTLYPVRPGEMDSRPVFSPDVAVPGGD
ncbi:sporulation-specific diadenylate cyclase CdaS [Paenibacillus sp. XY044]|uniref:sporulation-specific diadenylate cyclase CdaS n=1 Tax=Paenibacillus sp. XY044 TaxID=2026089 RepID=UPI00211AFF2D|nr:sporulation-specific diadenylate cyclase CdaS [Paenibacillus sp. XY044]